MTNIFYAFKVRNQHRLCCRFVYSFCQILILVGAVLIADVANAAKTKVHQQKAVEAKETDRGSIMVRSTDVLLADLISTIKDRKYFWDLSVFKQEGWKQQGTSVLGYPLIYYTCGNPEHKNTSLIMANVHGDEITPVFFGFRLVEWLKANPRVCENSFVVVAPMVNPDGFMRYSQGTRTNWNKIDLNRNFDTTEWRESALTLWKTKFKQRRYFPGDNPASEPEVHFQKWLIDEYSPSKILSVHAPLNILDYDGPKTELMSAFAKSYVEACEDLKAAVRASQPLDFYAYGVFPGSLGNYAGKQRGIPTFTVELPTTKWELAAKYFGDMEAGIRLFIGHELKEHQPRRMTKK